jgi:hypothetical protein
MQSEITTSLNTDDDDVGLCSEERGTTDDDRSGSHVSNVDDSSVTTPHSGSQSSTTGTSLTGAAGMNLKNLIPDDIMASRETRAIKYSRCMVLGILILSATISGVLTYLLTVEAEEKDFENQVRIRRLIVALEMDSRYCGPWKSTHAHLTLFNFVPLICHESANASETTLNPIIAFLDNPYGQLLNSLPILPRQSAMRPFTTPRICS